MSCIKHCWLDTERKSRSTQRVGHSASLSLKTPSQYNLPHSLVNTFSVVGGSTAAVAWQNQQESQVGTAEKRQRG